MEVEKWYDLCCFECGRRRSTDYCMGMSQDIHVLRRIAKAEGWKTKAGANKPVCPSCVRDGRHRQN